jgi:hypothetical protein
MSANSKFKWIRATPLTIANTNQDFYHYSLKNMRQIPSKPGIALANNVSAAVMTVTIPAGSWALHKRLLLRGVLKLTIPPGMMPPTYNISEHIVTSQSAALALPTAPAFVPVAQTFSAFRMHSFIRVDPNMLTYNDGDCDQHATMNQTDAIQHAIAFFPPAAAWDYTQQITLTLNMTLPNTIIGARVDCLWVEAFIEQGTNIGKLP